MGGLVNYPSEATPPYGVCPPEELAAARGHNAAGAGGDGALEQPAATLRVATWPMLGMRGGGYAAGRAAGRTGEAPAGGEHAARARRLVALLRDARFVHHLDIVAIQARAP